MANFAVALLVQVATALELTQKAAGNTMQSNVVASFTTQQVWHGPVRRPSSQSLS